MSRAWLCRSWIAVVVVVALVGSACSGSSGSTSRSSGSTASVPETSGSTSDSTVPSAALESTQQTVAALAGAGVATVADEQATQPVVAVTGTAVYAVTVDQAANMTSEANAHGGIVGTDLDAAVPMYGAPPMAYVIGGWVLEANDAASASASGLLGGVDWTQAPSVVFPTEVLALFVGDVVQHVATPTSTPTEPETTNGSAAGKPDAVPAQLEVARQAAPPILSAPCSTIANFFNGIMNTVFNALKLDPAAVSDWVSGKLGGGTLGAIAGAFAGWFASAWNRAVELAKSTAQAVLSQLTQPVIDILRLAIGAVATFTTVISYLKAWKAPIIAAPAANQFGITGGSARTGTISLAIDKQAEIADWPSQLVDCAETVGIKLPTLSKSGLPVTWEVFEPEALVTVDKPSGPPFVEPLDGELKSTLEYTTLRESAKLAATGVPVMPEIIAVARVRRTEVDDLRQLVTGFVTDRVPGFLKPVLNPILAYYLERATRFLDALINVEGSAKIVITHHIPKPPEPTTSSSATPTSNTAPPESASNAKCTDLTSAAATAEVGRAVTVTFDNSVAPLAGLTVCNVAVDGEGYPIQLAVNTNGAAAQFEGDKQAFGGVDVSGVGDEAFTSSVGIEVLSGSIDIKVTGPAGPVLSGIYTLPTAIARAMVAAH